MFHILAIFNKNFIILRSTFLCILAQHLVKIQLFLEVKTLDQPSFEVQGPFILRYEQETLLLNFRHLKCYSLL